MNLCLMWSWICFQKKKSLKRFFQEKFLEDKFSMNNETRNTLINIITEKSFVGNGIWRLEILGINKVARLRPFWAHKTRAVFLWAWVCSSERRRTLVLPLHWALQRHRWKTENFSGKAQWNERNPHTIPKALLIPRGCTEIRGEIYWR